MRTPPRCSTLLLLAALATASAPALAAVLPPHDPLRILIVSDEVNPHGLSDAELTQPGDLSAALAAPGSGLVLDPAPDGLLEIATDDISLATAALATPPGGPGGYDVLVYFAHRAPSGPGGAADQAAFVAAVDAFLAAGGGFVSFHHGSYAGTGKSAIHERIGATATGGVFWNTTEGQRVIDVAPGHFITTAGMTYPGGATYEDPARGVPLDLYPAFQNVPDERYPFFEIHPAAGEIELLFASDYDQNGTQHILGFTHERPEWQGIVVAYQPGEHQPEALDDLSGPNFQILANCIYYAATFAESQAPAAPVPALPAAVVLGAALVLAAIARRALALPGGA